MTTKYSGDHVKRQDDLLDLDTVRLKLQHLREIRDAFFTKSKSVREEIDKWQKLLQEKMAVLKSYQEQVVQLNEELTQMQLRQEELKKKSQIDPIKDYEKIRGSILKKRRMLHLQAQIKKLEWEYETRQLSFNEEKELISRLNELQEKLDVLRSETIIVDSLLHATEELERLDQSIHDRVEEAILLAEKLSDLMDELNNIKAKIVGLSRSEREYKMQSELAHNEYMSLFALYERFKKKIDRLPRNLNSEERKKMEEEVSRELTIAFENFKSGRGLTVDEFILLTKAGLL